MATVADKNVEESSAAAIDNDQSPGKSLDPADEEATGSRENNCTEMLTIASKSTPVEQSVQFVIKDETGSDGTTTSWRNYNLPHSTDLSGLYSTVAKEAGYVEGTFQLVWQRREDSGGSVEVTLEDCSATLYETDMPVEPTKTYLLIRAKSDGTLVQRVAEQAGRSSGTVPSTLTKASASAQTSNYSSSGYSSTYYSSSYGYGSSYNMKSETGFVGLVNQAMTCYLNSLLQTLYMTPEFRNALYRWKFEPKDSSDEEGKESTKCIPYQLQRLFLQLQTANKRAVETTDVTTSFGWDSSEAWQQHDVQELCRVMFDALEKRFMKDKDRQPDAQVDMINELYQGTWQDYVRCKTCLTDSARDDTFLDIPLVIKPFGSTHAYDSVEKALQAFVQPEILDGDNQYQCEHCGCKRDALKGLKFKKFPYLLTLQLKRFDFDYQNMHRVKLNDKMTFPTLLDLNEFIDDQEAKAPLSNDLLQEFTDYVVDQFDPSNLPPSYATATSGQYSAYSSPSSYSYGDNDDGSDADSNEEKDKEDTPQVVKMLSNGPYVYELFSVMVHSGSAIGGHYYAYIKSLRDKRWYCFNDQSVSRITREDLEQTFGGTDKSSRGYYSSMYSSSANAYMLMYRRIERKNEDFLEHSTFPTHLKQQIEDEKRRERLAAEQKEMEKKMCKFKLLCQHPVSGERIEKRLEVHQDKSLLEALQQAHRVMKLANVVPLDRCRLVKYDDYTETFDQSLDLEENDQTFGQLVGGARTYYSFELFLEIRKEDEKFQKYGRGGMNLRILVVDVATENVSPPVSIRAEQGWTVMELKQEIGKRFDLNPDTMNLVQELYNDGRHLNNDSNSLRAEGLYRKHNIYASSDPDDFKIPYQDSAMRQIVDGYVNSIMLVITLPPKPSSPPTMLASPPANPPSSDVDPSAETVPDLMPAGPAQEPVVWNDDASGEAAPSLPQESSAEKPVNAPGDGVSTSTDHLASVNVDAAGNGASGDASKTPPTGQTVTEVGTEHEEIPDLLPNEAAVKDTEEAPLGEDESKLISSSSSHDRSEKTVPEKPAEVTEVRVDFSYGVEGKREEQEAASNDVNEDGAENNLDVVPVEERPKKREIRLRVDRRTTLSQLKEKLEPSVGVPSSNFKVYRMYSNNQEYEMERLNDPLTSTPSESRLVVRLGRALKPGEHRIKLYLLKINQTEFCKFMMESIIAKGSPVKDFKKQIIVEARQQGVDYEFHEDRMRLRKKTWRSPGTVYVDHQLMDKDIYVYAGSEMYVEPLEGPEQMKTPTQMQVYVRRWSPSKYTIGPFQEVILDSASPEGLKRKISAISDIPPERVAIAKSYGSFPCEVSVLDIEQEMDWNPAVSNVNHAPLSLYDDGGIIYYKDLKEEIMELTQEQKNEIIKSERVRLNRSNVHGTGSSASGSSSGSYSYYRKEKALKIYTGEEDEDEDHRSKDGGN